MSSRAAMRRLRHRRRRQALTRAYTLEVYTKAGLDWIDDNTMVCRSCSATIHTSRVLAVGSELARTGSVVLPVGSAM